MNTEQYPTGKYEKNGRIKTATSKADAVALTWQGYVFVDESTEAAPTATAVPTPDFNSRTMSDDFNQDASTGADSD